MFRGPSTLAKKSPKRDTEEGPLVTATLPVESPRDLDDEGDWPGLSLGLAIAGEFTGLVFVGFLWEVVDLHRYKGVLFRMILDVWIDMNRLHKGGECGFMWCVFIKVEPKCSSSVSFLPHMTLATFNILLEHQPLNFSMFILVS